MNVVIYRVPRELSVVFPGSHCPACGHPVAPRDNVPVLGWLLLRGKARCCGAPLSIRYPMIELLGGALSVGLVLTRLEDPSLELWTALGLYLLYLTLALSLVALAAIDLETMLLPDVLTLGLIAIGLASAPFRQDTSFFEAIIACLGGGLAIWIPFIWGYEKLRGVPGMGLGDAKLIAAAGAWFGGGGALFALFAGAVQGTLAALLLLLLKGRIDEPEMVRREREEIALLLEQTEGEERAALEAELAHDPLAQPPDGSVLGARLPFGPFLALALLEYLYLHREIQALAGSWLWGLS